VRRSLVALASLAAMTALLVASASAGASPTPRSYLIMVNGNLPADLEAQVSAAGGTLTNTIPAVGIAVASSTRPDFRSSASSLGSVVPNSVISWLEPTKVEAGPSFAYPPTSGDNDTRFDLQWGHTAVDSVGAWNAGYRGAGTLVAVLDTGFYLTHADIASNVVGTASMVSGEGPAWSGAAGAFSHGTHVAGIAAAPDNAFGTIGVAPEAKLLLVKVLSDATGSGSFEDVVEGIVYAADHGADVINMSLGGELAKHGYLDDMGTADPSDDVWVTAKEVQEQKNAVQRAAAYANKQGATVIASAGNDASDGDHTADVFHLPSDAPSVLSIAATAPIGWAKAPQTTFLDNPASYTNFGQSVIDFAAPGGDAAYPGNENCTVGGLTRPCWVFDLVFSPGAAVGSQMVYFWAGGTSMAAPHATGVAAIIIGKNGGSMSPAHVEAALRASADDLGKPGNDDFYGAGRVNAANAVD
jgi:subtilisin family serine protease